MAAQGSSIVADIIAIGLLAAFIGFVKWLDSRPKRSTQLPPPAPACFAAPTAAEEDHNPGGPLTDRQARKLFEDILQAAIRQNADAILIDRLSGRPQVRLQVEGNYQELTGIGDKGSFLCIIAQARSCAGLATGPGAGPGGMGSFSRLYRKPHVETEKWRRGDGEDAFSYFERSRKGRAMRFDLESYPAPGGEALRISLRPEVPTTATRFDLGFAAAAEDTFIRVSRSRSGIVLLTGPCNSGKSTATYNVLSILRDEGRRIATVEWPRERKLKGVLQYDLGDGQRAYDLVGACLQRAIRRRPDVLMLQNIDWVNEKDAHAAIDFAASGLLITAIHVTGCAYGLGSLLRRHGVKLRPETAADLLKIVVAPRRLFMVCMHCAEEHRVPAKVFVQAGMSDPPVDADGKVATWRGRGCSLCDYTGNLGAIAVYEVLDLTGAMRRFIDNSNDWRHDQVEYLERQAWQHGMRTHRELALERVLAGDISLKEALLNTVKPKWLVAAQATMKKANE
jgi:type II secretory ATPase GspE/PulE/Tfp pilus assembly ATPase PilB-like protein